MPEPTADPRTLSYPAPFRMAVLAVHPRHRALPELLESGSRGVRRWLFPGQRPVGEIIHARKVLRIMREDGTDHKDVMKASHNVKRLALYLWWCQIDGHQNFHGQRIAQRQAKHQRTNKARRLPPKKRRKEHRR